MPEPVRKRRFVSGQDKKFDPNAHLDLRFGSRRKRQVGRLAGGNVVLTKKEFSKIEKPSLPVFLPKGKDRLVQFSDRRYYPSKGRRKEDREFSD